MDKEHAPEVLGRLETVHGARHTGAHELMATACGDGESYTTP